MTELIETSSLMKLKKVSFDEVVKVFPIPRHRAKELKGLIWWSESDYRFFKKSSKSEISLCQEVYPNLDDKTAAYILYNPSGTLYDGQSARFTSYEGRKRFLFSFGLFKLLRSFSLRQIQYEI